MTTRWSWTRISIVVLLCVTIVGGAGFMLSGVGVELGEWREVRMAVVVPDVHPDVATQVKVGDPVYTDPAAMYVGVIEQVDIAPMLRASPDASGALRVSEDPLVRELTIVVSTRGRRSAEIVAVGSQVVQVGMEFAVVSRIYQLQGWIVEIDVR